MSPTEQGCLRYYEAFEQYLLRKEVEAIGIRTVGESELTDNSIFSATS